MQSQSRQTPYREETALNPTAAKLLTAASELMIDHNSLDVSLSDIAQRAGVNAALVKYHFGNKEGLLLALLKRDARAEIASLNALAAQALSPTAKLKLHVSGIINAYRRFPYLNRLIHLLLHNSSPRSAAEVSDFFVRPLFAFQRGVLERGFQAGEFRKIDPGQFYVFLIGSCDHLFSSSSAMENVLRTGGITDEVCRDYADFVTNMVLSGLAVPIGTKPADTAEPQP